ncbi:hypothetical protein Nepgr_024583 [Nepenthes gracilis]|uniref:Disease resistance R13L4/SHOC-2-like LRR domain-containing protein n=1 Tax=Nepenthes gracilis TaxID=150966 RepID=A0AAD3Y073_NEPGR|nr:hypothetical protein Nepgr_024583 [Nepenthes gracilis]
MDLNQTKQNVPPLVLNESLRRLAIHVREEADEEDTSLPDPSFEKAPNIRSLLFFPNPESMLKHRSWMRSVCNNFRLLRVLDLNGFDIGGSLPKEIGNLIYLRFLSLNQTWVSKVPSSIGNLSYLEILDLRVKYGDIMLPNVLWKLRRLRHLYFPFVKPLCKGYFIQGYKIKRSQMIRLDGLQYLETLENVDMDGVEVKGLLKLRTIRKLTTLRVSKKEDLDSILKFSSIKRLSFKMYGSIMNEDQMILSSCQVLYKLNILGEIHGPLRFEMFPKTLVYLCLEHCNVKNDPMPVFEWLPQLKNLILYNCYSGDKMECSAGGFPQLKHLEISFLSELREWKVGSGALPNLEKMEIFRSPNLVLPDGLPSCVNIGCNPCVKGIEKYNSCPYYKGHFEWDQKI